MTQSFPINFSNKSRWLTRPAYGYSDEAFLHLKIYDLPNLSTQMQLLSEIREEAKISPISPHVDLPSLEKRII